MSRPRSTAAAALAAVLAAALAAAPGVTAHPAEDDPAFDCRVHGNQVCGPDNPQGVAPGDYSAIGVLSAIATATPHPAQATVTDLAGLLTGGVR